MLNALPVLEHSVSMCLYVVLLVLAAEICNFHSFLAYIFTDLGNQVIQQSSFVHALIHANFTSHTPSPPTQLTLTSSSPHPRRPSPHHLPTFPSPLFLNTNERLMEASSILYFWDHHTPIQIVAKPAGSTGHCTCVFIINKLCAKLEVCRNPQVKLTLSILGEMPIPIINLNRLYNTCTMLTKFITSQRDHHWW